MGTSIVAAISAAIYVTGNPVAGRGMIRVSQGGDAGRRAPKSQRNVSGKATAADPGPTYAQLATRSTVLLEGTFYNGNGLWHMCYPLGICSTKNRDWGAGALTNLLYFRWLTTNDQSGLPILRQLAQTARYWPSQSTASSDSVMWDAVAELRIYQATRSKIALAKAAAALQWLATDPGLATGACPAIDYQWPYRQRGDLKTIETASNYIKALLLMYQITGGSSYLATAQAQYADVRHYFLAKGAPLYTAYMFDNGTSCHVLPGQYFASVNGNMIWAGVALAQATGKPAYLRQAIATARAVRHHLSDAAGVFADLQADNDIVGPLVEAMYSLATTAHQAFAARWLMTNASAAGADTNPLGEFGRFFDGPPPVSMATAWQIDGGIAVMMAAAALHPGGHPADPGFWQHPDYYPDQASLAGKPVQVAFTGRAIAILGEIGAQCCAAGHASVRVDGVPTFDRTGIWQGMDSPARRQPEQVLFAWRWLTSGHHVITIGPAPFNSEQGGSFFQMTGYLVVK